MRFCAKNAGYSTGLSPHIGDPVVRTDGRSRDYYVTTKISWLDMLPNLLSNGAPLARQRAGSAINFIGFVSVSILIKVKEIVLAYF